MKQLKLNRIWENGREGSRLDLRAAPDGRYLDAKTATAWTKYYLANK